MLTLFEPRPHINIIFRLKTNCQKRDHVNGSQTRISGSMVDKCLVFKGGCCRQVCGSVVDRCMQVSRVGSLVV